MNLPRRPHERHGLSKTPEYNIWQSMLQRCTHSERFPRYAGRGIKVCMRWQEFGNFLDDMGLRPTEDHTLERIDNDGNYEPGNCKWATRNEQSCNRANNIVIDCNGIPTRLAVLIKDVPEHKRSLVYYRLKRGWSLERALALESRPKTKPEKLAERPADIDKFVLDLRGQWKSYGYIGALLGVSRQRVEFIEMRAQKRLSESMHCVSELPASDSNGF